MKDKNIKNEILSFESNYKLTKFIKRFIRLEVKMCEKILLYIALLGASVMISNFLGGNNIEYLILFLVGAIFSIL